MRALAFLLVTVAGCPSDPGGGAIDAASRDALDDAAAPGEGGLAFEFTAEPSIPAVLPDDVEVDSVEIDLADIRAVGDAAPGDERTFEEMHALAWSDGNEPEPLRFPAAPPGLYSRFQSRIGDARGDSYRIHGEVVVDGTDREFEIHDDAVLPLDVPLVSVEVIAGEETTVTVWLDVALIVQSIDWSSVPLDGETLRLGPGDAQIAGVRARLMRAFGMQAR